MRERISSGIALPLKTVRLDFPLDYPDEKRKRRGGDSSSELLLTEKLWNHALADALRPQRVVVG